MSHPATRIPIDAARLRGRCAAVRRVARDASGRRIGRTLRLALLLPLFTLAACEDELNDPEVAQCDELLEFQITQPATVSYLVAVGGSAVLHSVTYTTPGGDVTVDSPPDERPDDDIQFQEDIAFDGAAQLALSAEGEVATGGQIGISYIVTPEDETQQIVTGPIELCSG